MKKLITCGDSYMSPTLKLPNTHFTEIFAQTCEYELIPYARSGIGNGGIVMQIESAIRDKPDLIMVSSTFPERMEFASGSNGPETEIKPYFIEDIHNLAHNTSELSEAMYIKNKGNIISESLATLLYQNDSHQLSLIEKHRLPEYRVKKEAIKIYFNELYHYGWKDQVDKMMIYATMHRLHLSGIPYIFAIDQLRIRTHTIINHLDYSMPWMTKKEDLSNFFFETLNQCPQVHTAYHTTVETQQEIAQFVINHYNKYF